MTKRITIPIGFDDALSSLLQVKPPAKEKPAEKAKQPTKRTKKVASKKKR
jgi:hypothetical protein